MQTEEISLVAEIDAAYNFAQALQGFFSDAALLSVTTGSDLAHGVIARVEGSLGLGTAEFPTPLSAGCGFDIRPNWPDMPPKLWCNERWIQRQKTDPDRADWHLNRDGSLCFVLHYEWRDWLAHVSEIEGAQHVPHAAAYYAINNLRWLLQHHLEGHRRRLDDWDPSWPQWPHADEDARRIYKQRKHHGR